MGEREKEREAADLEEMSFQQNEHDLGISLAPSQEHAQSVRMEVTDGEVVAGAGSL